MKLILENWKKFLKEETIYKNLSDETFLHFTTKERAEKIKEMRMLLKCPEGVVKCGTDTIDAISLVWGKYVPRVQTTHYGKDAELVGVVFKTRVPPKYGYVEEVKWDNNELPITDIKIISFEEAVQRLKNTSEEVGEMDMVKYNELFGGEQGDMSDTLFLVRSWWGVDNKKWDHIGFLLSNGKMKDMSGHRGEYKPPEINSWEDLRRDDAFKHLPETKEEAEEQGLYREIKLPKEIEVPNEIVCRVDDPERKAENCGTFVVNVLYNNEIDLGIIKSVPGISVAKFD